MGIMLMGLALHEDCVDFSRGGVQLLQCGIVCIAERVRAGVEPRRRPHAVRMRGNHRDTCRSLLEMRGPSSLSFSLLCLRTLQIALAVCQLQTACIVRRARELQRGAVSIQ